MVIPAYFVRLQEINDSKQDKSVKYNYYKDVKDSPIRKGI